MSQKDRLRMMRNRAQSTLEYMILLAIIVGALIAMEVYMKRAMQGRMRNYAQDLSEGVAYSPGATRGYSVATIEITESSSSKDKKTTSGSTMNRTIDKTEELLPFALEPPRR